MSLSDARDLFGDEPESDELSNVEKMIAEANERYGISGLKIGDETITNEQLRRGPESEAEYARATEDPVEFDRPKKGDATQPQIDFINGLLIERDVPDGAKEAIELSMQEGTLTKSEASDWIGQLKALPASARTRVGVHQTKLAEAWKDIPEGRYAVEVHGKLRFFKVDKPKEGRWAGYVFLNAGVGGPHDDLDWSGVKNRETREVIRKLIVSDPKAAAERFGREVGACAICGRSLTDETSRAIGVGPICRGGSSWYK